MKKIVLASLIIASGLLLSSCNGNKMKSGSTVTETQQTMKGVTSGKITNSEGVTLMYSFDESKKTGTFVLNGETIKMDADNSMASGAHYKNDHYTFSDWHGTIELAKDGKVIFRSQDQLIDHTLTNAAGKKMDITFNNTRDMATINLDGETIVLKGDTVASGIQYSNTNYRYVEHQGNVKLEKDGRIIFETKK